MFTPSVHQELQPVILLLQIRKENHFRIAAGPLHIIHMEFGKIANHNPAGALGIRQFGGVPLCLLERGQQRTVRLLDGGFQVFVNALLLNQHMGRGDNAVNEAGMVQLHLFLKRDKTAHILNTQHIREQRQPKCLALSLLIAFIFPVSRELPGGYLLLRISHTITSASIGH